MIYLGAISWAVAGYLISIYWREPDQRQTVLGGNLVVAIYAFLFVGAIFLQFSGSSTDGCAMGFGLTGSYADC